MTARSRPRRLRRGRADEGALTEVLGAILLFGLLVVTFMSLRVSFVPKWENDREAQQMLVAQDELGAFKTALDLMVANQTGSSVSTLLQLGAPHTTIFGRFGAYGSVGFVPGASGPHLTADQFQYILQNGVSVASESWTSTTGAGAISNVGEVQSFRLRFTISEQSLHKNYDSLQLQVKDASNVVLGTMVATLHCDHDCKASDNVFLVVETDDAGGNVLYSQGYAVSSPSNPRTSATFWVDVLDPTYRFTQLLSGAPTPFNLALTDDGLSAEYAITYRQITQQGTIQQGGGGQSVLLDTALTGGTLTYRALNQYFPQQTLILENGALLVDQPGTGSAFVVPPDLQVAPAGTALAVHLGLAQLSGAAAQIAGSANVQLQARASDLSSATGVTPHLVLNFTTTHPGAYRSYFTTVLGGIGLQSSGCAAAGNRPACNYQVTQGTTWVQVDLYGYTNSDADNASATPAYDVTLELASGTIAFALVP